MTLTAPEILPPRYQSVERIARGGMGEIYVATDDSLGRQVAVKVLSESYARDEALRARFTREALAAAKLSGEPNTVTIFDVGEWNGRPYIVMELATGGTVGERARSVSVGPPTALRWVEEAGTALDAAHAHGIVHRDVKPANLLLAGDNTVRVADFGIASAAGLTSLTETGTVLGTMGYLAPEQAAGGEVGPAADRYALAVVAYELLAGRRPYEGRGTGPAEAIAASLEPVPPISQARIGLPPELDASFEQALHRDPAKRYASCSAFAGDLRRAFENAADATRAHVVANGPPPPDRRTRNPWPAIALLLLALAGAGLAAALFVGGGREAAPEAVVKTVTAKGQTVTVTSPSPPPATTTASEAPLPEAPLPEASGSGGELNSVGFEKMQAGDYEGALPLFEQAVQSLGGAGSTDEAYALYNLAFTRLALGSCEGVVDLLDRSEQIQGRRTEIRGLRREASRKCGGSGNGNGDRDGD